MAVGVAINNDNGVEIIGPNAPNFAMVASGVLSTTPPTVDASTELLALRKIAGNDYHWYKFGRASPSADFGLQLFDAAGQLQFCAATLVARVVDVFQMPARGQPATTRNYPAGRTYATTAHLAIFTEVQTQGVPPFETYRIDLWRSYADADGNSVTAGWDVSELQPWTPVPPGGVFSFPAPAYTPWCIVLDVTGY